MLSRNIKHTHGETAVMKNHMEEGLRQDNPIHFKRNCRLGETRLAPNCGQQKAKVSHTQLRRHDRSGKCCHNKTGMMCTRVKLRRCVLAFLIGVLMFVSFTIHRRHCTQQLVKHFCHANFATFLVQHFTQVGFYIISR